MLFFGLIGVPPTGGFVGKFLLAIAAVRGGAWIVLTGLILSTGISAYVYLKVIGTAFTRTKVAPQPEEGEEPHPPTRTAAQVVLAIATAGTLVLGVLPGPVSELLRVALAGM